MKNYINLYIQMDDDRIPEYNIIFQNHKSTQMSHSVSILPQTQQKQKNVGNRQKNTLASLEINQIYFKEINSSMQDQLQNTKILTVSKKQLYFLTDNQQILKQIPLNHQIKFQILKELQQKKNQEQKLKGVRLYFGETMNPLQSLQFHIQEGNYLSLLKFCRILQLNNLIQLNFHNSFQLHRRVAKGGFSTVLQAWRLRDQKLKAIKAVSKKCEKWDLEDVLHEGDILKQLNHRGIVKYQGMYESQGSFYLVFENLDKHLNFHELSSQPSHLKFIFWRLLKTLSYLKSKNIIHRDIKLDNIMLRHSNKSSQFSQPVLLDFGFAINANQTISKHKTPGTFGFYAPQIFNLIQSQDSSKFTYASDIFQLGVVFFHLLTGKNLINGTTIRQVMQNNKNFIISQNIFQGYSVNENAKDLVVKMLHNLPDKRITVEQAFNHDLFHSEEIETMPIIQNKQVTVNEV